MPEFFYQGGSSFDWTRQVRPPTLHGFNFNHASVFEGCSPKISVRFTHHREFDDGSTTGTHGVVAGAEVSVLGELTDASCRTPFPS